MAKSVREYDLVFSEDEVRLARTAYHTAIQAIAKAHFLDKGMTEEEIGQNIKFGNLWEDVDFPESQDGVIGHFIKGIRIEVEEIVD